MVVSLLHHGEGFGLDMVSIFSNFQTVRCFYISIF